MERRVALAAASAAGISLAVGTFSYAAVGGVSLLGFGGSEAPWAVPPEPVTVRQVQTVDDVVVVVSTTQAPAAELVAPGAPEAIASGAADPGPAPRRPGPAPAAADPAATSGAPVVGAAGASDEPVVTAPAAAPSDGPATGTTTPLPASPLPGAPTSQPPTSPAASSNPPTTPAAAPPTTASPPTAASPPTTSPTATTVRPPGVPKDWPADRPIPPMPPNCQKPQLEDNGVWNCEH